MTVDVAGVASEAVAIVAIAGVITAPVGFILGGVGMGCFGIGLVLATIKKKIEPKLKKHDEIRVLVEAKLNTISELIFFVSKALDDNQISQTEFVLIKSELRKFYEMKNGIKNMQLHLPVVCPSRVKITSKQTWSCMPCWDMMCNV